MEKRGIPKKQIEKETKDDLMEWFVINPWNAYEGGSYYGIPEITGHPEKNDSIWPTWLRHSPTSDLRDVGLELWGMARDRAPLGGHMMDEENKRRAVCEFAGNLLSKLFEAEEQARTE